MKWFILSLVFAAGLIVIVLIKEAPKISAVSVGTQVIASSSRVILTQSDYRWYENIDSLTPTTSLASENQSTTTPSQGTVLRLRLNIKDESSQLNSGATFVLQYANSTSGAWTSIASGTAWTFFDNPSVADGQIILTTLLSDSDLGESYGESNPSAASPNDILPDQKGEWDWVVKNNSADTSSNWYFRMIYSSSTEIDTYQNYPALTAAPAAATATPSGGGPVIGIGQSPAPITPGVRAPAPPIPRTPTITPVILQCIDLNGDNRVDIIDLSILLYHYSKTGPEIVRYDCNKDNRIDLADISILMFYWTS